MNKIYRKEIESPLGKILLCADEQGICLLDFFEGKAL